MFVSKSTDRGQSWSTPFQFAVFTNPVCLFPPSCFNISGGQFRGPGSYPAPAYNPANNRLYVAYADIDVDGVGKIFITSASANDLASWTPRTVVAAVPSGDRFAAELGIAPSGRIDVAFYDRSYTSNTMVDLTYATSATGARLALGAGRSRARSISAASRRFHRSPVHRRLQRIVSLASTAGMTWTGLERPSEPFPRTWRFSSLASRPERHTVIYPLFQVYDLEEQNRNDHADG
jgi:hypothetical protein